MKKILIANWKMNKSIEDSVAYAKKIKKEKFSKVDLSLAASFTSLEAVAKALQKSEIKLAAQNIGHLESGSLTGEVSVDMIKEAGCSQVIIGHSERRILLNETNELISQKLKLAYAKNIMPIFCVGETKEEKQNNQRDSVLVQQIKQGLSQVPDLAQKKMILAYEPVWAIGSGQIVDLADLQEVKRVVKRAFSLLAGNQYFEEKVKFIYGGSVDLDNVANFLTDDTIDGFLVGGASLAVENFISLAEIIENFNS